jgi:hypothetical protein
MVFASDTVEIRAGAGTHMSDNGTNAGRSAALNALCGLKLRKGEQRFGIVISDPLNAGVSDVSRGVWDALGETFPLIGAASAAHSKKRTTFQFAGSEVLTDSVVLLLFAGPVSFSFGINGMLNQLIMPCNG